ncbi:hypothetical protein [Pseudoduganella sp. R-43]|uniref:sulfotransferase family protein n=1 Tax=unclassified Pseudoduganella TaxID=2637179 RepID=UPI003CED649C
MHRSGTSAITRGLSVLGVDLGDRLLPAVEGNNAKGFWEDIDLNALNIEMLKFLGRDWSHLAMIRPAEIDSLRQQEFFLRAVELVRKKIGGARHFGFKDPRVATLLPFWRAVFAHCGFEVSYVFAMRNPLSVVRSLGKRDGIESEQSYLLWLAHVVSGLSHSTGSPCVVVDYDRLMQAPEAELARLARALKLEVDAAALQLYKEDFLDENLRHTQYVAEDLLIDPACPQLVHEVYLALLEVAADRLTLQDTALQTKIRLWFQRYEQLQPSLRLNDKLLDQKAAALAHSLQQEARMRQLQQASDERFAAQDAALNEREVRLAAFDQHLKSLDAEIVELRQALAARDGQVAQATQLTAEHSDRADEMAALVALRSEELLAANAAAVERDRLIEGLRAAHADCEQRLAILHAAQDERETQLNQLRATLAQRESDLGDLRTALAARDTQLEALRIAAGEREHALEQARTALGEGAVQLAATRTASAECRAQLEATAREMAQCDEALSHSKAELAKLQDAVVERERQIASLRQTVQSLLSSTSWRVSAPVRWLGSVARVLGRS